MPKKTTTRVLQIHKVQSLSTIRCRLGSPTALQNFKESLVESIIENQPQSNSKYNNRILFMCLVVMEAELIYKGLLQHQFIN